MGVGIQDTRGLINGEGGGVYEGTITSACKGGSLASIVVLTRSLVDFSPTFTLFLDASLIIFSPHAS